MPAAFNRPQSVLLIWILCVAGAFTVMLGGAELPSRAASPFEQAYAAWLAERQRPESQLNTHAAGPSTYVSYGAIIKLGPSALPEIMEKLPSDPLLLQVVWAITKKRFTREILEISGSERAAYIQNWLRSADETTGSKFSEELERWKRSKREANSEQRSAAHGKIRDLGTLALPHLFEKIAKGEGDLISVASEITGGELPPTATVPQSAEWWRENRVRYTLPAAAKLPPAKSIR